MYDISVITPVYNGEKFIADTVEMLESSTIASRLQFVLVNDGSKDNSAEVIKELASKYSNILFVDKPNGGIASARNAGLDKAEGRYICFCDHDDYVEKDIYERLLNAAEEKKADLTMCGTFKYINGDKEPLETFEDRDYSEEEVYSDIIRPIMFYGSTMGRPISERWVGSIWKGMYRKDIIDANNIRFRRHYNYEDDLLFFVQYALKAHSAVSMSYAGYGWRINPDSETHNWKYIDDLYTKYFAFIDDITGMLEAKGVNGNDIREYKRLLRCQFILQYVTNEGSVYNKKSFPQKIGSIRKMRKNLTSEDFLFRKKVVKSYTRTRIGLELLNLRLAFLAYAWLIWTRRYREGNLRKKV